MRGFDADGLLVCKYQASIFERSLIKTECGSAVFTRRFMNSDVAAHLDTSTFANEATAPDEAFDLIDKQYGPRHMAVNDTRRTSSIGWAICIATGRMSTEPGALTSTRRLVRGTCGPYILLITRWILHRRLSVLRRQGGSRWPP